MDVFKAHAVVFAPLGRDVVAAVGAHRERGDLGRGRRVARCPRERERRGVAPGEPPDERVDGDSGGPDEARSVPLRRGERPRGAVEARARGEDGPDAGAGRDPVEHVAGRDPHARRGRRDPQAGGRHGDGTATAGGRRPPGARCGADRALGVEPREERAGVGGERRVRLGERAGVAVAGERAQRTDCRVGTELRPVLDDRAVVQQVELVPVAQRRAERAALERQRCKVDVERAGDPHLRRERREQRETVEGLHAEALVARLHRQIHGHAGDLAGARGRPQRPPVDGHWDTV